MSYQNETNSSRPWNKDKIFHMISKQKKNPANTKDYTTNILDSYRIQNILTCTIVFNRTNHERMIALYN